MCVEGEEEEYDDASSSRNCNDGDENENENGTTSYDVMTGRRRSTRVVEIRAEHIAKIAAELLMDLS